MPPPGQAWRNTSAPRTASIATSRSSRARALQVLLDAARHPGTDVVAALDNGLALLEAGLPV
jgi:hypothetical protein